MIVRFAYVDLHEAHSHRRVWPVQSVCTEDRVFLDAFCLDARAMRRFRCDRMSDASVEGGAAIDEPEPFFAALAVSETAATAYSEKQSLTPRRVPASLELTALSPFDDDAAIIATLEALRRSAAVAGDPEPEWTAAQAVQQHLAD